MKAVSSPNFSEISLRVWGVSSVAEFFRNFAQGVGRVLYHVVEQPRKHRGLVLFQVRKDLGHLVGVFGIGHAALAVLAAVGLCNKDNGILQDLAVQGGILLDKHIYNVLLVGCQFLYCHYLQFIIKFGRKTAIFGI